MKRAFGMLAAAAAAMALAAGCAHFSPRPAEGTRGHLVIIGGGLRDENAAVYGRMAALAGDSPSVAIVPTATGVPEETGPAYVEVFESYLGPGRAEIIPIPYTLSENAKDPAVAARIAAHDLVFFTGGDQARIIAAFLPGGERTVGYDACWEVLNRGGVVAGTSAGAAMMSDPSLRWGTSAEALLVGVTEAQDIGIGLNQGMGFFPYGISGQHFLLRGRMGRMVAALEHAGRERGFGVADDRAIHVDLSTGRIEVIGDRGLLLVDISGARRDGLLREGVRLSLLNDGDVVDGPTGAVTVPAHRQPYPADAVGLTVLLEREDAWAPYAIAELMEELAAHPATQAVAHDPNFEIRLSRDARTRFFASEGAITAIDVRLDIVPKDGADAARAELLARAAAEQP